MMEFFKNFLVGLEVMFMITLFLIGLFGPMILGISIHPLFILTYIISIPICCACVDYFMEKMDI